MTRDELKQEQWYYAHKKHVQQYEHVTEHTLETLDKDAAWGYNVVTTPRSEGVIGTPISGDAIAKWKDKQARAGVWEGF